MNSPRVPRSHLTICLILLATYASFPANAQSRPTTALSSRPSAANFAGKWDATFGVLTLEQQNDRVTGSYDLRPGTPAKVEGRVVGNSLNFTFEEPDDRGEGRFELSGDGQSFAGKWKSASETEWNDWNGKRIADPKTEFTGLWRTTFGPMRLRQTGSEVRGSYLWNGSAQIQGKCDGKGSFAFTYEQTDGERGEGVFSLAGDGLNFEGRWKATDKSDGGNWSGKRVESVPGRVWLVVLEENWESSLAEPEYSYGQMLRSFFTRVPNIQVRHRFVHTVADFRRWAAEAGFFAEPVVLYISSHGSAAGVQLGAETLTADALIDALRPVGQLRLLHFGSCEVMSGDVPRKLSGARPPAERFPISGFTKTADWAGSAIVDFTYLELVLARGMDPAAAAAETRKLIKFADEDQSTTIAGSGLRVFVPRAAEGASAPTSR